jgi:lysophospholipase L1-like esterase
LAIQVPRSTVCVAFQLAALAALSYAPGASAQVQHRPHRVVIIGDSITLGFGASQGGYPTRAQVALQASEETFTAVLNRGLGGWNTSDWLAAPTQANWDVLRGVHPDVTEPAAPPGMGMAEAVASVDAPLDAIVILLGVNDLVWGNKPLPQVIANLHALQDGLRPLAGTVLISTLTPSRNLFTLAAILQLNDLIRAEFPDFVPLGDQFLAQPNWYDLLADSLHPTDEGQALLASILASELSARGLTGYIGAAIDAFKCYQVTERENLFEPTTVDLQDQFGVNDGSFNVKEPFVLCNPVARNGGPLLQPSEHLTCYTLKGPNLPAGLRPNVEVQNEFGTLQLEVGRPFALCARSAKTIEP